MFCCKKWRPGACQARAARTPRTQLAVMVTKLRKCLAIVAFAVLCVPGKGDFRCRFLCKSKAASCVRSARCARASHATGRQFHIKRDRNSSGIRRNGQSPRASNISSYVALDPVEFRGVPRCFSWLPFWVELAVVFYVFPSWVSAATVLYARHCLFILGLGFPTDRKSALFLARPHGLY